jgi:Ser/Thr protein kinase RdoA (MazF antagonist)
LNQAKAQSLVHGDAKVANFCFSPSGPHEQARVAAVDFQYVGRGVGVKDVAYLFSSCLDERESEARAEAWLDYYFECLSQEVMRRQEAGRLPALIRVAELEEEWRALYPVAWADFLRFLDGWAPGHYKIHGYSLRMARQALLAVGEGATAG